MLFARNDFHERGSQCNYQMTSWSTSHHEKHNYVNCAFEPVINNYAFKLDLIHTKVSKGKNS